MLTAIERYRTGGSFRSILNPGTLYDSDSQKKGNETCCDKVLLFTAYLVIGFWVAIAFAGFGIQETVLSNGLFRKLRESCWVWLCTVARLREQHLQLFHTRNFQGSYTHQLSYNFLIDCMVSFVCLF